MIGVCCFKTIVFWSERRTADNIGLNEMAGTMLGGSIC